MSNMQINCSFCLLPSTRGVHLCKYFANNEYKIQTLVRLSMFLYRVHDLRGVKLRREGGRQREAERGREREREGERGRERKREKEIERERGRGR